MPRPVRGPGRRGRPGDSRWVLKVDVNDGAPSGGSGGQYFVGGFDGKEFRPDDRRPDAPPSWLDYGKDFYAAQAWNDAPGDRPVWIAWMNNLQYGNYVPTSPWRGAMTVPRRVALRDTPDDLRIVQSPVEGVRGLRRDRHRIDPWPNAARRHPAWHRGTALEIVAEFEPGMPRRSD